MKSSLYVFIAIAILAVQVAQVLGEGNPALRKNKDVSGNMEDTRDLQALDLAANIAGCGGNFIQIFFCLILQFVFGIEP